MGFLEKHFPLIFTVIAAVILFYFKINILELDGFQSILNATITITSIIIAFLGTMMTILITLANEKVMVEIRRNNKHKDLLKYIKATIFSGLILALYALFLFIYDSDASRTSTFLSTLFISLCIYFVMSSYRIFAIVVLILDKILDNKTDLPPKKKPTVKPRLKRK